MVANTKISVIQKTTLSPIKTVNLRKSKPISLLGLQGTLLTNLKFSHLSKDIFEIISVNSLG